MKNLLIAHGGGPTSVINASLYGVIIGLKELGFKGKILAPRFGSQGLYNEDFIDLSDLTSEELEILKNTPGSAIGSSRFPLYEDEYNKITDILIKNDIEYVLFTGGNGTMDTIGNIYKYAKKKNLDVTCVGIPKTVDNDVGVIDHAPGYASAANFVIQAVSDCGADVRGLPIHVSVIEIMGRNSGWLTASSALARNGDGDAPHLIYLPEIPFDEDEFIKDVKEAWDKKKGVVVVCSEGLKNKNGEPIVKPIYQTERATYYGDVSTHLATLIIEKLGIKARSEKFGLVQRCFTPSISKVDQEEAIRLGKLASKTVLNKINGVMVGLKRKSDEPYKAEEILIPIEKVMLDERKFPMEFISENKHDVTESFIKWLTPLVDKPTKKLNLLDKKN